MYEKLARNDLGSVGSFGGGIHDKNGKTIRRAVILVHGTTNNAGRLSSQRTTLLRNGWSDETVYATTYGSGSADIIPVQDVSIECEFVQQIRDMITVVSSYTQRKVDVIGYSLGSPIARKAILGGFCVDDSSVNLGDPLTNIIETYISVGGANQGSYLCVLPLTNACSVTNGLFCSSSFLVDINSKKHYEGNHVYSIYGPSDDVVGFLNICLSKNSKINGADDEYTNVTGNHEAILSGTMNIQMEYLRAH